MESRPGDLRRETEVWRWGDLPEVTGWVRFRPLRLCQGPWLKHLASGLACWPWSSRLRRAAWGRSELLSRGLHALAVWSSGKNIHFGISQICI